MCIACTGGIPVCSIGACGSPNAIGQAAVAAGLPILIGLTLFRSKLAAVTDYYLHPVLNKKLF